ncbi:hypothetical protein [Anaeromyxobacter sp. Fw109-5]|uniref:hypothetical protein n=1 Tax=Anaeromyxobacter sp. (strain Fw109-5) TaxID=404589 RepID=UPI000158A5DF|nr:hypothetical protein [Anaeromyxobacter sp. Fw109-5]ABS24800.1 conserved hypothetical protein [Anaeromyxobacter sp. Fw109-5]
MRATPRASMVALALALGAGSAGAADDEPRDRKGEEKRPDLSPRAPELDFDLLGKPAKKANPEVQRKLETRRKMLTLHTGIGIATWAALATTTAVGQLDFDDRFRGGGDTGKYHGWHTGLAYGTSALFLTTALLGVLAPKPFSEPARLDTALLHKIAMGVATAGMITQIVLGVVARGQAGSLSERDLATAHQLVGYSTLGAMTFGMTVLVF